MALIDLKTNLAKRIEYDKEDLSTQRVNNAESNYDKFQPDDGQLIQKDVGERYRNTKNDGGLFRGGIALQAERTIEDAERVGKFLGTGKGRIFTLKQLFLQSKNGDKRTNIYNPLSVVASLPPNVSEQRHLEKASSFGGFLTSLFGLNEGQRYGDRGELKRLSKGGDPLPKDFIKFRIRDAVNGRWLIFPALISGITDNSTQTPTTINYIGRPDSVYVYGTMNRTIGFNLKVVALNESDIETIWEKVNYLKGLVQPQFKQFFTDNETTNLLNPNELNTRPVAPIVYLTIGDMFVNTPGFFNSVNVTVNDTSPWETKDGKQFPHVCDISLDFQYIGKEVPTMLGKNYEGNVGKRVVARNTPAKPKDTTTTQAGATQQTTQGASQ
jgi:hypothetical protein